MYQHALIDAHLTAVFLMCLRLIYTIETVMQNSSRAIMQSVGVFLNED